MQPLTSDDPQTIAGYRLRGRLGDGGQGVVYLAEAADGRQLALKVLHTRGDAQLRDRFAKELAAAQRVSPAWIARIVDASLDGPRPYIASEYVEGPSLARAVSTAGPFAPEPLMRLASGLMMALAAIHRAGIVHRDFKPANVLLGPDGPRLIDFGVARASDMTATPSGNVVGTPLYLAPESFLGHRAESPSDVFAWGAVVYFAATGRHAFHAAEIPAVMHRILHDSPDLSPLPEPLRAPVAAALAKDPAARPTAAGLLLELTTVGHLPPPPLGRQEPAEPVPAKAAPRQETGAQDRVETPRGRVRARGRAVRVVGALVGVAAAVGGVFAVRAFDSGTAGTPGPGVTAAARQPGTEPPPGKSAGQATETPSAAPAREPGKSAEPGTTRPPTAGPASPYPKERTTGNVRIYYNLPRAAHAARAAKLVAAGFQPTSLSLAPGERYTAVWVKRQGPAPRLFHGLNPDAAKRYLTRAMAAGYRLKLIAGLGAWENATYAGVMVKQDGAAVNHSFWRMTKAQFQDKLRHYQDRGRMTLRWVSAYGPASDRRYAAVWEPNVDTAGWRATVDLGWAQHKRAYDRLHARGYRPTMVAATPDRRYSAVWRKESSAYFHYGDLTPDAYRTKLRQIAPKGYYPAALQVSGTADHPFFTAVWAPE
ncbi:protein kinase [Nonomuraea sp. NPDC050540]|uniref:protein kinase domain-containing protein n=1 Tax=Nonomuraea sp. NPDC050540 TaxID=3364367 RepID=UPI0037A13B25